MEPELKQRLIGAVVVTALAAIFVPMLFDDPVDNSGQQVSELAIPKAPEPPPVVDKQLPEDFGRALTAPTPAETAALNAEGAGNENTAETTQPADNNPEEELVATETDTDTTANTNKSQPVDTLDLDTGEVIKETKEQPKAIAKIKEDVQAEEPKLKKKPKTETKHATEEDIVAESVTKKATDKKANTASLGRWSIQAGSFSKKENAETMLKKLRQQGFPATLQSKGDIYRIKIGPELDKQRASDMKRKLDNLHIQSLMIVEGGGKP
jgi:DedD protein